VIAEGQWLIRGPSGWWVCSPAAFTASYKPAPTRQVLVTLRYDIPTAMSVAGAIEFIRKTLEDAEGCVTLSH
jgi:hypothetical protein